MKQETAQTAQSTISGYHNMHKKPIRKYRVLQIRNDETGLYRWAVVWFTGNGIMNQRFPMAYGMRSAVRLASRLEKEWEQQKDIAWS